METGLVSEESLQTILRQIGQKRRQGVLELSYPDRKCEVWFQQGKAVEALISGETPAHETLELLRRGLVVAEGFQWSPHGETSKSGNEGKPDCQSFSGYYRDLFLQLAQSGNELDAEVYRRVIRQRILDQVYSLELEGEAVYRFHPQMVEVDREFAPTISVGQLLLDLVALPHNKEHYHSIFPAGSWVSRTEVPEGVLTVEERILYDCLEPPLSCEHLRERAMLSDFHFMDGLLALHERGLVATQIGAIRTKNLSVRDMVQRTVHKSVEAGVVVESIVQGASSKAFKKQTAEVPGAEGSAQATAKAATQALEEQEDRTHQESEAAVSANQETQMTTTDPRSRWNLRVLESAAAVQFIAVLYVLIAFSAPWLSWGAILRYFAE